MPGELGAVVEGEGLAPRRGRSRSRRSRVAAVASAPLLPWRTATRRREARSWRARTTGPERPKLIRSASQWPKVSRVATANGR